MGLQRIIGNRYVIALLMRAFARQHIAHAYLFTGPSHLGKRTTALEWAKLLNCERPITEQDLCDACDECASCYHIAQGTSLDVQLIRPVPTERALTDGGRGYSIRIDDMRQLRTDAQLATRHSRWKVYIVDDAEHMTDEAANCVLKTLEEPPLNVVIILVTANYRALPRTVVSRCQVVRFRLVPSSELIHALCERGASHADAQIYACMARGRPGLALLLARTNALDTAVQRVQELFEQVLHADVIDAPRLAECAVQVGEHLCISDENAVAEPDRKHALRAIEALLNCVRDAWAIKVGVRNGMLNYSWIAERLSERMNQVMPEQLLHLIDLLNDARTALLANANVQLTLEVAFMRWVKLRQQLQP
ncbi:MAG TPA: DNA polymerase III subunit delta' [Armatimonadetes bacterium]|nr:DNA polymerase III subunit delta' [Armatimonadota bacterium]